MTNDSIAGSPDEDDWDDDEDRLTGRLLDLVVIPCLTLMLGLACLAAAAVAVLVIFASFRAMIWIVIG